MNQYIILAALFFSVLFFVFTIGQLLASRRDVRRNLNNTGNLRKLSDDEMNKLLGSGNESLRYYLDVVQNGDPNSLRMRLVQAGFFKASAIRWFNLIRIVSALAAFALIQFGARYFLPQVTLLTLALFAVIFSGLIFVLASVVLERRALKRMREFRKLFPDFMDLLLVCVDAGLSINAAIDRVTREFLLTTEDFGVQLSIIALEIRAGRPLHEALTNFSVRIRVEEARTLAVLFRQSEELGASVSKTLRVFAREMRQMRIIRAEEKANSLPIKMLMPMAFFMFPVNLIIVLVPILLVIVAMLGQLSPR